MRPLSPLPPKYCFASSGQCQSTAGLHGQCEDGVVDELKLQLRLADFIFPSCHYDDSWGRCEECVVGELMLHLQLADFCFPPTFM
jgi:hypothetical protein